MNNTIHIIRQKSIDGCKCCLLQCCDEFRQIWKWKVIYLKFEKGFNQTLSIYVISFSNILCWDFNNARAECRTVLIYQISEKSWYIKTHFISWWWKFESLFWKSCAFWRLGKVWPSLNPPTNFVFNICNFSYSKNKISHLHFRHARVANQHHKCSFCYSAPW